MITTQTAGQDKNNESVQGLPVGEIARAFGTPLYIYDAEAIRANYLTLRECFSEHVDVFFSLKANPNISIAALLNKCGAGAEVCSLAELETAVRAGFAPCNIIFVGPYKSTAALKRCLELNIYTIVCESKQELLAISQVAQSLNCIANVTLRINPVFSSASAPLKMGGKASQFGIDQIEIMRESDFFLTMPNTNVIGIHVYNGTRILDAQTIYDNTRQILGLAETLSEQWQRPFALIDIGGGFGIPYFAAEKKLDSTQLKNLLLPLTKSFQQKHPATRLITESGRYLVGTAGLFVSCVHVVKSSRDEIFLITDGGTNCHMAAVGTGSFVKRNFPITAITRSSSFETKKYNITGPLCTPNDVVGKQVELPITQAGDLIVIKQAGAYGPSASPVLFLSHGHPAEVLIHQGKAHLIRQRDSVDDLLHKQKLIDL